MRPFPDPKPDPLTFNQTLQQHFDAAMASTPNPPNNASIVIVDINPDGSRGYAAHLGHEYDEYYAASLLKVAAMYAAFEFRTACRQELFNNPAADPYEAMRAAFDNTIRQDRLARLTGVSDLHLLPKYDQLFSYDPSINEVEFTDTFWNDLTNAIVAGDNALAGRCVQKLGFGYITGASSEANFFDADSDRGVWLCGDFAQGYPPQRIPCVNDTPTAQGTSAYQMAKLFTLLFDRNLVEPGSDDVMLDLLRRAVGHTFLNRDPSVNFSTLHSKIGLGPVNAGHNVASEALVIQENATFRKFVVVFLNQKIVADSSVFPIARVVDETIVNYIF